ncbi:MAG: hypothetical protein CFK49_10890 [Armatimonadetes bacterium JP3_11]|nr:MAG: hypothetical protein CFK49_10890 [Armatimonadetes bacterium JP3_11]
MNNLSKKQQVLDELFKQCQQTGNMIFDNNLVKQIAQISGFGNPFDVTKVDTRETLPPSVTNAGYCVAHLGAGKHRFIPELQHWFHDFESILDNEQVEWRYRKSLLNDLDRGEASTLSLALNQHVLHDFIYEDVVASPKIYIPGRTRTDLSYWVGGTWLQAKDQQLEMDLVLEYQGTVTVLEAKNRFVSNFAVYQIFHPVKYYFDKTKKANINIAHINACYVLKQTSRKQATRIRLYLYEFTDHDRLDSIRLVRKAEYILRQR